jgi:hypothetical protein
MSISSVAANTGYIFQTSAVNSSNPVSDAGQDDDGDNDQGRVSGTRGGTRCPGGA